MTAAPVYTTAVRPAAPKGWLATLLILLLMVGIVVGGFVAAESVADLPDQPISLGNGVTIVVPPDWEYGGRADDGTILLSHGNGNVAIRATAGMDERAALEQLRNEWLALGTVAAGDIEPVPDVRAGQPAARFAYSGTFLGAGLAGAVEGEVTGVRGSGSAVVFDAWAGEGQFVNVRDDIAKIINEATIP